VFSFADLSTIIAFAPGYRFPAHTQQFKSKAVLEITHQELCPDPARVVLTLGA
jgi:hypothetical protein